MTSTHAGSLREVIKWLLKGYDVVLITKSGAIQGPRGQGHGRGWHPDRRPCALMRGTSLPIEDVHRGLAGAMEES